MGEENARARQRGKEWGKAYLAEERRFRLRGYIGNQDYETVKSYARSHKYCMRGCQHAFSICSTLKYLKLIDLRHSPRQDEEALHAWVGWDDCSMQLPALADAEVSQFAQSLFDDSPILFLFR